ncbi:MAG: cobalt ECF transporter T component CbiQ [Deltaproteobacteria bacterium]|nr:cobalt ECF transporter T component CbiQ [Deltaproteobacteria bacterium]
MAQMTLPGWFKEARGAPCAAGGRSAQRSFVEKNLARFNSFTKEVLEPEEYSKKRGLLQWITPKARIAGIFFMIAAAGLSTNAYALSGAVFLTALLTAFSGVGFSALAKRVWPAVVFTLVIISPVFFSFFTPGERLFGVSAGPFEAAVTREGVLSGLFFVTRAASMVSLAALLLLTTGQTEFFRGLAGLPVPRFFVTALYMMFRYVFILLKVAEDANLALKSRTAGRARIKESQQWFSSRAAMILRKSLNAAEEVSMAMASRGFDGKIKTLRGPGLAVRDYIWLAGALFILFLSFGLSS